MIRALTFALFLLALPAPAWAANWYVKAGTNPALVGPSDSCARADVQAAHDFSSVFSDDTVVVGSGTCNYDTVTLSITKGIWLKGNGDGTGATRGCGSSCTIIVDEMPVATNSGRVITVTVPADKSFRISGFDFRGTTAKASEAFDGYIRVSCGQGGKFRIDHNTWTSSVQRTMKFIGNCRGVIDHLSWNVNSRNFAHISHNTWGSSSYGDGSWAAATNFGSADFIFLEDNDITDANTSGGGTGKGVVDFAGGGRAVVRYNAIVRSFIVSHGTESGERDRGLRAMEVYENTINQNQTSPTDCVVFRGGTGLVYNNDCSATTGFQASIFVVKLQTMRTFAHIFDPWRACDGRSGGYDESTNTNVITGTTDASSSTGVFSDATKDFTTGCLGGNCNAGGFTVRNITRGWGALLSTTSVTATTVTALADSTFGTSRTVNAGDSYAIHRVRSCVDGPGRGQSNDLGGVETPTTGWVNNAYEPIYVHNNTKTNYNATVVSGTSYVHQSGSEYITGSLPGGYTAYTYPHPYVTANTFPLDASVAATPTTTRGGVTVRGGVTTR